MINLLFSLYNYLPIHMPGHHIHSWSPSCQVVGAASTRTRITEGRELPSEVGIEPGSFDKNLSSPQTSSYIFMRTPFASLLL